MKTRHWWIARKRFSGEEFLLTPSEADEGIVAKTFSEPSLTIMRLQLVLDPKDLEFEETARVWTDKPLLAASTAPSKAKLSPDGSVLVHFVKRLVSERIFTRDYSNRPGYWPVRHDDASGGVFVAFSRPVFENGDMPEDCQALEDFEEIIMGRKLASSPGWWNA